MMRETDGRFLGDREEPMLPTNLLKDVALRDEVIRIQMNIDYRVALGYST